MNIFQHKTVTIFVSHVAHFRVDKDGDVFISFVGNNKAVGWDLILTQGVAKDFIKFVDMLSEK